MRKFRRFVFLCVCILSGIVRAETGSTEVSVCGVFKEPLVFWVWQKSAGQVSPGRIKDIVNSESISYLTRDGRKLVGYKLMAESKDGAVLGSVLVAQGNAMLADQLLRSLNVLSSQGIEVYVFDYRGYGDSEGKSRLKAIVGDYIELYQNLVENKSGRRLLYGISFGGVVLANVIASGVKFDRAVIDSAPSRLSPHGCDERYDAAYGVPDDASGIMVLAGERDHIVKPRDSEEFRALIEKHGGKSVIGQQWSHPYMDNSVELHSARMTLITNFLLGQEILVPSSDLPIVTDTDSEP